MDSKRFFTELKRRNVYRVGVGYAVIGWLIIQVAATIVPALMLPSAITAAVVLTTILGFPLALVLAWAFEITPEGIQRTEKVAPTAQRPRRTARKLIALVAVATIATAGLYAFRAQQRRGKWAATAENATNAFFGLSNTVRDKSIAVLPFQNISDNQENAFFADGVQEEILTALAKLSDLKVISRTSVMQFREPAARKLPEIAAELNVAHVLQGSVQRAGNRIRVTAQLIDARTDDHLWAEKYDRELSDVFAIQSEIAQKIAHELRAALSPGEEEALRAQPTANVTAYDFYLRAREIDRAGRANAATLKEQIAALDQAVAHDPTFVAALCLLARAHGRMYFNNFDTDPGRLELAKQAVDAAARLQPDAGEVHLARGLIHYWGTRNYEAALAELAIARQTLPNEPDVLHYSGVIQRRQGLWEESTRNLEAASALDPRNATIISELANTNYVGLKRYADAARVCDALLVWKPDYGGEMARARVDRLGYADVRRMKSVLAGPAAKNVPAEQLAVARLDLAFLERDYAAAQQALAATTAPEFPGGGYVTPREWYAALIAQGTGRADEARAAFAAARERAAAHVAKRPDDAKALMILAEIEARLGNKEPALQQAARAVEMLPLSDDALDGLRILGRQAGVLAHVGEADGALELLEQVTARPSGPHYGELMLDERWDPLRGDPRFDAIVASVRPPER